MPTDAGYDNLLKGGKGQRNINEGNLVVEQLTLNDLNYILWAMGSYDRDAGSTIHKQFAQVQNRVARREKLGEEERQSVFDVLYNANYIYYWNDLKRDLTADEERAVFQATQDMLTRQWGVVGQASEVGSGRSNLLDVVGKLFNKSGKNGVEVNTNLNIDWEKAFVDIFDKFGQGQQSLVAKGYTGFYANIKHYKDIIAKILDQPQQIPDVYNRPQ